MKARKAAAPAAHRSIRSHARPRVEVETRVSQLVGPKLEEWVTDLERAAPCVIDGSDPEGVHDLRVALRRIRSLLRLVRQVYGSFHTNLIRAEMARVANATGSLRDEEVLVETLDGVSLAGAGKTGLAAWRTRRKQRQNALRSQVISLLQSGALREPVAHLRALLSLPCSPKRDGEVRRFARQVVLEAQANVDDCRSAEVTDAAAMHMLRIAYKRLRYCIEAFSPVLPPELRAWRDVAAKFQSVLGDLHDHDVALEVVRRAAALRTDTRNSTLRALVARREAVATKYAELSGHQPVAE
jgi:CHAD domain-containing protein